jgi:hypothetical protein
MRNNGGFCEYGDVPTGSMTYGNVSTGYMKYEKFLHWLGKLLGSQNQCARWSYSSHSAREAVSTVLLHWLFEIRLVMLNRAVFIKSYPEYHAVGSCENYAHN